MKPKPLRILVIGAHPDDADLMCGGLAVRFTSLGHEVKFVSCTNGDTGHHMIGGIELARRRFGEAQASAKVAGISEYEIFDNHTGELESTIANRKQMIRAIREYRPDLIVTHRPYDYHPDHRCTSTLVLDAAYIATVPNMLPLTQFLDRPPKICYMYDHFTRPAPFRADVVLPIDDLIDKKLAMLDCHASQMYEWLPFNRGLTNEVPPGGDARREWLLTRLLADFFTGMRRELDSRIVELYGEANAHSIKYVEALEFCEYGAGMTAEDRARLFPFLSSEQIAV